MPPTDPFETLLVARRDAALDALVAAAGTEACACCRAAAGPCRR